MNENQIEIIVISRQANTELGFDVLVQEIQTHSISNQGVQRPDEALCLDLRSGVYWVYRLGMGTISWELEPLVECSWCNRVI